MLNHIGFWLLLPISAIQGLKFLMDHLWVFTKSRCL